jgi:hypothetical protein
MDSPDTVTEALALLRAEGYDHEFQLVDGHLTCGPANVSCSIADATVDRLYRFEGPSDPGDEMIVFGLSDPATGTRGVLASAFGPSADPELLDHLVGLSQRQRPA